MRLSWRDAGSTVVVVVGLAIATSVAAGWNWPLLGGVREGIIALTIVGVGAFVLDRPVDRFSLTDPFGLATMLVVMAAAAIGVVGGLIVGAIEYLLVLVVAVCALWFLATVEHAVEGSSSAHIGTAA